MALKLGWCYISLSTVLVSTPDFAA